ncbi:MAG: peptide ABC transporter substrate-binding protein [Anaerolineales bacterium]|nr:peptide ABC transporter substrate-binding protein [Anaerolineales bacterium]
MELIKKLRWQLIIVFLGLLVIVGVLWNQRSEEPAVIESPEPTGGGVYAEGVVGSLIRLNPQLANFNPVDRDVTSLLFRGLIQFDSKGLPQPDISNSWGISRTGETYNFSLRDDVFWHDGVPLTSEDVVFTIELLQSEEFPTSPDRKEFWQDIEVEALDDFTLQMRLPEAFAPFLDYLEFGILPAHLLGDLSPEEVVDADFNLQPVGSGPYQFNQLIIEDDEIKGVSLIKNPDYYGQKPFLEEVIFYYYSSDLEVWQAYLDGEIQGIGRITSEFLDEALAEPELNTYTSRLPKMSLILFNLDNPEVPFFQEREIRQALILGLNRQWIIDNIYHGQAVVAQGPILPKTWAYFEDIKEYSYEPEQAVQILQEAGFTIPGDGGRVRRDAEENLLEFSLAYPDTAAHKQVAEAIQKNWQSLGIGVQLVPLSYEELIQEQLEPRVYQAALVDINFTRSPDPDPYPFWHQAQTTGGQNYSMWDDRQASEYLEQARIALEIKERERMYKNFQVRFMDQLPAIPLLYPMYTYGVSSQVNGVRIGPIFEPADRLKTITDWYFFSEIPGGLENTAEVPPAEE